MLIGSGSHVILYLENILVVRVVSKTVSYDEYFRQIFGGLGVLPVFWNSQERLIGPY